MNPIEVFETTSMFRAVLMFFFRPAAFVTLATQYDAGYNLTSGQDLRQKWEAGTYDPVTEEHRTAVIVRASSIRRACFKAALLVASAIASAMVVRVVTRGTAGQIPSAQNLLQLAEAGILLWSTIWQIGWGVRSIGGETLSERVHNASFRVLAFIGTVLFLIAYLW